MWENHILMIAQHRTFQSFTVTVYTVNERGDILNLKRKSNDNYLEW